MTDAEVKEEIGYIIDCYKPDTSMVIALRHALLAIEDRATLCAAVEILSRRDTEGFMQDALDASRRHMQGEQ
jgi:hypothetical protein